MAKAIPRLINPEHVDANGMLGIAILGIIINSIGFYKLHKGKSQNEKILSLHLLEDMLGWVALIIASILIIITDLHIIDPLLTIGFTIYILIGIFKNLKESFNIVLEGVPSSIDLDKIKKEILKVEGVIDIHDLHIWSLEGETYLMTAHILIDENDKDKIEEIKKKIRDILKKRGISHSTLEIDIEPCKECELEKE